MIDEPNSDEPILNEPILDEPVLSNEQIDKFKNIYSKSKTDDINEDDDNSTIQKLKKKLNQKDDEAQLRKLQTEICCKKTCFQKLDHDHALSFYQKFQNLNNNQKDMLLLGVLVVTMRNEITTKNQKRQWLASNYIFEGIEICYKAFLTIYGIGEKYWNNIQAHFAENEISLKIHKLVGKISNFAVSFETILEILIFIVNYANIHGLPSPGIYNQFFLIKFCNVL